MSAALLAHRLDHQALGAAPVELAVEDLLPRTEVESAGGDRDDRLLVDKQVLQMRVAVVLATPVVAVVAVVGKQFPGDRVGGRLPARRGDLVEPFEHVLVQAGLVVVDPDAGGDVHRRDQHHALLDAGLLDCCLHLLGDADQLATLLGFEGHIGGVGFHWTPPLATICWPGQKGHSSNSRQRPSAAKRRSQRSRYRSRFAPPYSTSRRTTAVSPSIATIS